MKKQFYALIAVVLALLVVGKADAIKPYDFESKIVAIDVDDDTGAKGQSCAENQETMDACRSFIKGFIQGALLTDTAIIKSIEEVEPTFAERAMRTRLGKKRSQSPTALAGFCLPADRSILELAEETLDHVRASERNSVELAKNVYSSLKVDYPCDESEAT